VAAYCKDRAVLFVVLGAAFAAAAEVQPFTPAYGQILRDGVEVIMFVHIPQLLSS